MRLHSGKHSVRAARSPRRAPNHNEPSAPPATARASRWSPWILVGRSSIHGRGVYARVAIPAETRIIEYTGERITKAEARRREEQRLQRLQAGRDGSVTIFELNQRYDLDARGTRNPAVLINHSCAPNCHSENDRGRIWIVARRDIAAGEELTFDYGFPLSEWRLHPCRCGAQECPGHIVGKPQRWRLRKLRRAGRRKSTASVPSAISVK